MKLRDEKNRLYSACKDTMRHGCLFPAIFAALGFFAGCVCFLPRKESSSTFPAKMIDEKIGVETVAEQVQKGRLPQYVGHKVFFVGVADYPQLRTNSVWANCVLDPANSLQATFPQGYFRNHLRPSKGQKIYIIGVVTDKSCVEADGSAFVHLKDCEFWEPLL